MGIIAGAIATSDKITGTSSNDFENMRVAMSRIEAACFAYKARNAAFPPDLASLNDAYLGPLPVLYGGLTFGYVSGAHPTIFIGTNAGDAGTSVSDSRGVVFRKTL